MRLGSILLFFIYFFTTQLSFTQSLFSQGNIYQLDVTEEGIYKIDYEWLLQNGFNVESIDPTQIAIYGLEGGMLPQSNAVDRPEGIQSLPIQVIGESDGSFDQGDAIYFYAQGSDRQYYNTIDQFIEHEFNLYDSKNHYYLCIDSEVPTRVQNTDLDVSGSTNTTKAWSVVHYEKELKNFFNSGRYWLGEEFTDASPLSFTLDLDHIQNVSAVKTKVKVVATARVLSSFDVSLNGALLGQVEVRGAPSYNVERYERIGNWGEAYFTEQKDNWPSLSEWYLSIIYNINDSDERGYLDAYTLNILNSLQTKRGGNVYFLEDPGKYNLSFSNGIIWDVTSPYQVKQLSVEEGQAVIESSENPKFILFDRNDVLTPTYAEKVSNIDLLSLPMSDLLIISHADYTDEATRLGEFRATHDGLTYQVVDVVDIFREFSSGKVDVTAMRDFIRYQYLKNTARLKYVLLFGTTSYDTKGNVEEVEDAQVPIYQSREILFETRSFSSDDYFGFMGDEEGYWQEEFEGVIDLDTLDLGVGRLPVKTLEEAENVVDKLITYSNNQDLLVGNWKQLVTFVADDGNTNLHQRQANQLSTYVEDVFPIFNSNRIFLDDYFLDGNAYPDVNVEIDQQVEDGTMILNYSGHGGIGVWADENILSNQQIRSWNNEYWPLMVTATCEFGRYDYPPLTSGAEVALLLPNTGAIGLLTTTRPVYSSSNFSLNLAFYSELFRLNEQGNFPRLGDVIKNTKNNSISGVSNRNFALLGDPTMSLIFPQKELNVVTFNGKEIVGMDTLSALQTINIEGEVLNALGETDEMFDGEVEIVVFGRKTTQFTNGNRGEETIFQYDAPENILFKGIASVTEGIFDFSFVVPKDITYDFGEGKMSFYAHSETEGDAAGYWNDFVIGGTAEDYILDETPPEVQVWLESRDFNSGEQVNANTLLLVDIFDESGMNMTGLGVGHDIIAWIDDDVDNAWILNDYYQADKDTYQSGSIAFPVHDLPVGKHRLTLKVWDAFNNPQTEEVEFVVNEINQIVLEEFRCYPNPVIDQFNMSFRHNMVGEDLLITMKLLAYNGSLLATEKYTVLNAPEIVDPLRWTKDAYAYWSSQLYIVVLEVYAPDRGFRSSKATKVVFE